MKSRTVRMTLALALVALCVTACGTARPRVITLAGSSEGYADGSGSIAQFSGPLDVAVDAQGNRLGRNEFSFAIAPPAEEQAQQP